MHYSEQFNDAQLVYDSLDGKPWKPLKQGSGYQYGQINKYVRWLHERGAEFIVRRTSKNTLLVKSDIHTRFPWTTTNAQG